MAIEGKLAEILISTRSLPTEDKFRLIRCVTDQIESDLKKKQTAAPKSLRGIWKGLNITAEEIAEARKQMWRDFPRGDI